jgi:hypothetical protein
MYLILFGLVFDCHDSLSLTSMSLLYRYDNVLSLRSLFFLLNTFYYAWSRLVTIYHELLYILSFYLYICCINKIHRDRIQDKTEII